MKIKEEIKELLKDFSSIQKIILFGMILFVFLIISIFTPLVIIVAIVATVVYGAIDKMSEY